MPRGTTRFSSPSENDGGWTAPSVAANQITLGRTEQDAPVNWLTVPTYGDEYWFGSTEPAPLDYMIWISDPVTGERGQISYEQAIRAGVLDKGLTVFDLQNATISGDLQASVDKAVLGGGGGGYSGGGGATGPVYVKPDQRLVEEGVKASLVALAGKADPGQLSELVSLYMSEHRRSWDLQDSEQVDPMESVKAKIRDTSEYKAIHQLRPDSSDEYDWVSSRIGALKRAGVTDSLAEELGISQATVGASDADAATAGNVATFSQSGQQLDELKNRMRNSMYGVLSVA